MIPNRRETNLRKSQIWRLSIFHYTPSPERPANSLAQPPWLTTLYEVLHKEHAIKIRFRHCSDEIIFVND